jgi:hypothetical protein
MKHIITFDITVYNILLLYNIIYSDIKWRISRLYLEAQDITLTYSLYYNASAKPVIFKYMK